MKQKIDLAQASEGLALYAAQRLAGLLANRQVGGDTIAGTFLIAGSADGEFCSLTDEDAARYGREFAQPLPSYSDPDEPTQWEFHVF